MSKLKFHKSWKEISKNTLKSDLSEDDLNAIKAKIKSSKMKLSESKHGLKEIEVEVEVL